MNIRGILVIILFFAFMFALWYVFLFPPRPGIQVSCSQKMILGFKRVPPPLMAVIQTEICRVGIVVKSGDIILCSKEKFSVFESDTGVFPCSNLKNYEEVNIQIEATFFDTNDQRIGLDSKTLIYQGV